MNAKTVATKCTFELDNILSIIAVSSDKVQLAINSYTSTRLATISDIC